MLKLHTTNRPQTGFTLLELMIAVAILGILMAIAAPSFQETMASYSARTGAEGILNGLQLARSEAIRRNANVSLTLSTGGGWTIASGGTDIQSRRASESGFSLTVTSNSNNTVLTFNPLGMVANFSDAATLKQITVTKSGTSDSYQIDVFAGGAMRMCNPAITASNDPRRC